MFEIEPIGDDVAAPSKSSSTNLGIAILALVLPVLSGIFVLVGPSLPLTSHVYSLLVNGIYIATVVVTAVLLSIDARQLGTVDHKGHTRESSVTLFIGMCLLWVVFYPLAFFWRKSFGGPHLGFVALIVTAFFVATPFIPLLIPQALPSCSSTEVAQLLEQVLRQNVIGPNLKSVDGHREVSYDRDANVRHGECVAHTDVEDVPVKFDVEWQDRNKGLFQVRALLTELPSSTGPLVATLLEQILQKSLIGAKLKSIDGRRELSYDREANVRHCECVVHTDNGEKLQVKFAIEWQDRNKGLYQVRILPSE